MDTVVGMVCLLYTSDPNLFKSKKTVLEYFNNSYDLKIKFKDSDVHLIKSTDGFFCLLNENNTSKALLYNNNNHTWYDVDIKNQTRSITTVSDKMCIRDRFRTEKRNYESCTFRRSRSANGYY